MKNLEKYISYSCYRYAPEQFKLTLFGKLVKLDYQTNSELGNLCITGQHKKLMDKIKKMIRQKTNWSIKIPNKKLAIRTKNNPKEYIFLSGYWRVNQFNVNEKLQAYKDLKESLETTNYKHPITVTRTVLDGNYKPTQTEDRTEQIILSRRIVFV